MQPREDHSFQQKQFQKKNKRVDNSHNVGKKHKRKLKTEVSNCAFTECGARQLGKMER